MITLRFFFHKLRLLTSRLVGNVGEERGELTLLDINAPNCPEAVVCIRGRNEGIVSIEAIRGSGVPLGKERVKDGTCYNG